MGFKVTCLFQEKHTIKNICFIVRKSEKRTVTYSVDSAKWNGSQMVLLSHKQFCQSQEKALHRRF